jgi:PEP-CTERM/exosortase A-associated glycosyltransferase
VGEARLIAALARRAEEVAKKERPEILHAHSPVLTALAAIRVGRKLDLPIVYEIRAFWEDAAVDHGTYREGSWKYRLTRAIETWACRRVDRVTVLCRGLLDDLAARGIAHDRMTVVGNAIDLEDFRDAAPDEEYRKAWKLDGKRVVGFIGSFYRYEGLDLLVEAMARIAAKRADVVLLLVGGGEMEEHLQSEVRRLGLLDRVVFPGRIPHERVPGVYSLIDVLAYPRYSMRLTDLVTPLKPLEAMAMGKALVASDVGGHRELIEDGRTGILFKPGDAAALESALLRVLETPTLRRDLERAERAWVAAERTWDRMGSVYETVYAQAKSRATDAANPSRDSR